MLIRQMKAETFRRICMSFDAWIVAFGLSKLLRDLAIIPGNRAFLLLLAVILVDAWLLYRFFGHPSHTGATTTAEACGLRKAARHRVTAIRRLAGMAGRASLRDAVESLSYRSSPCNSVGLAKPDRALRVAAGGTGGYQRDRAEGLTGKGLKAEGK